MLAALPEDENSAVRSMLSRQMAIAVPEGERYWIGIDAVDWVRRQLPGATPEVYDCKLFPTSHRLLIFRRDALDVIVDFDQCDPFTYRRLGMMGFLTASEGRWQSEWFMHWALASALVTLLNDLREVRRIHT